MSKTKNLPPGIPIADSNGIVTTLSVNELAKQVGTQIGVHTAEYSISNQGWFRIANIGSSAGILLISSVYTHVRSIGAVISFSGAYYGDAAEAKLISGTPLIFDKLRFVKGSDVKYCFLELHSSKSSENEWLIRVFGANPKTTSIFELYQEAIESNATAEDVIAEYTLAQLKSGGG